MKNKQKTLVKFNEENKLHLDDLININGGDHDTPSGAQSAYCRAIGCNKPQPCSNCDFDEVGIHEPAL